MRFDVNRREPRWNIEGQFQGRPALDGETIYIASPGGLDSYDIENGTKKGQIDLEGGV
jgi:hypothetical protein